MPQLIHRQRHRSQCRHLRQAAVEHRVLEERRSRRSLLLPMTERWPDCRQSRRSRRSHQRQQQRWQEQQQEPVLAKQQLLSRRRRSLQIHRLQKGVQTPPLIRRRSHQNQHHHHQRLRQAAAEQLEERRSRRSLLRLAHRNLRSPRVVAASAVMCRSRQNHL